MTLRRPPRAASPAMLLAFLLVGEPLARAQTTAGGGDTRLLHDAFGIRHWLEDRGVDIGITETSEVFGNASGGLRRGVAYDGMTQFGLGLDLGRLVGLKGGIFNLSALQIHGRSLSNDNLASFANVSSIEAAPATRIWEMWYDQQFAGGRFDGKIGLQSVDQEFLVSSNASFFANTMFGWPAVPSYDLYSGGPAYPLASLGVRGRAVLGAFTLLGGVFADNPTGSAFDSDPQPQDDGLNAFNLRTGALFIAELDYGAGDPDSTAGKMLPGSYKVGAYFDTAAFPDLRFDDRHTPYWAPGSTGKPLLRRHNYMLYAVADQMVWRQPHHPSRSLGLFARVMGAPGDRNVIDFAANLGMVLNDPLPGRPQDSLGFAGGITKLARNAVEGDRQAAAFADGAYAPVRSDESYIELFYQYQPRGWLTLQPDLQYIFLPGGGVADPGRPGNRVGNEFVSMLRATITF